jgi:Tfp pilus assembly protein PilF
MSEADHKGLKARASFPPTRAPLEPLSESGFSKSEPPSGSLASEEFLFHLYRGSEFLQDNQVEQAKDELERALLLQPRDVEGQGLLGVVYFRLGLYPRAIDIYERLSRVAPSEVAPKVNLALCYLKTGQLALSRQSLEEVLALEPEHKRAWGYLGLIFQRQSEYGKARSSFERAGQSAIAERMRQLEEQEQHGAALLRDDHPHELRRAAESAFEELEYGKDPFAVAESTEMVAATSKSGRWRAIELGEETMPQVARVPRGQAVMPEPQASTTLATDDAPQAVMSGTVGLSQFVQSQFLAPPDGCQASLVDASTAHVTLHRPFAIRVGSVRAAILSERAWAESRLMRRNGPRGFDEPLGGANDPIAAVDTQGTLVARAYGQTLTLLDLHDESLTIREENVFGFDAQLRYDCTRFEVSGVEPLALLELSGTGLVLLRWTAPPRSIGVSQHCTLVRTQEIVGWTGRLVPQPVDAAESPGKLRGFVGFFGEGAVFVS